MAKTVEPDRFDHRADKFALAIAQVEPIALEFREDRGIAIRDLPPAMEATRLALSAADR